MVGTAGIVRAPPPCGTRETGAAGRAAVPNQLQLGASVCLLVCCFTSCTPGADALPVNAAEPLNGVHQVERVYMEPLNGVHQVERVYMEDKSMSPVEVSPLTLLLIATVAMVALFSGLRHQLRHSRMRRERIPVPQSSPRATFQLGPPSGPYQPNADMG